MLSFEEARTKVIETMALRADAPETEILKLAQDPSLAVRRILAENVIADRNYPPFNRSIRDGFAARAADLAAPGAKLKLVGESRAGVAFTGTVVEGQSVHILTGAPVPRGANAVVMQEKTREDGESILFEDVAKAGQNYILAGAEARVGEVMLPRGSRLSYAELAVAAEVGASELPVFRQPRIAILSTGDELVSVDETPGAFQIRNSNNISLAAQVTLAGGIPILAGSSRDDDAELRDKIGRALESADMLITSGGVSVGKYDRVEMTLRDLGAEFFFDGVAMRPGKPIVFGWCKDKPVFGLPGNPVSTMVTFELFVAPAIELLGGFRPQPIRFFKARLSHPVQEKAEVDHFLPARVTWLGGVPMVEAVLWESSGDIGAVVRGNCYLLVRESQLQVDAGEWVDVLPRRGVL
jgi:molybdopterin molybdotransferase